MKENKYNTKTEKQLATGKISTLFRKFAIPSVIGLLFLGLQTIIDGIILGNVVGANALASVSLILPCYTLLSSIGVVIGVGCQTFVSVRLGQKNYQGANNALTSGFLFLIAFSITASILLYIFAPEIAVLLGANHILLADSVNYTHALAPFFPIISLMFFTDYILKATGRPIYAVTIMSSAVLTNIVLDIIFVKYLEMGTTGARLATGISFSIGALFSVPKIITKRNKITVLSGRYERNLVYKMFYNGSSEGLSELSSGITILLFNITTMRYLGENGVAAFTAINYVLFIGITISLGIADGTIPIISYNFGAKNWDRIKKVLKLAVKTVSIIGIIIFTTLSLFGEEVISLFFKSEETTVIKIAVTGTGIYAFAFLLNGLNILASSYFTALTNAKISIIISSLRGLIFIVIGIFIYPRIWGINGIWFTVPIAELCTFIVSFILVKKSLKNKTSIHE